MLIWYECAPTPNDFISLAIFNESWGMLSAKRGSIGVSDGMREETNAAG